MKRTSLALLCSLLLVTACSDDGAGDSSATTPGSVPATEAPATTDAATTTTAVVLPEVAATIDELLALDRPIVLAHTAGEDEFPASTLFAFGESVKAGVDMLDLNVLLTEDGVLIVQHDDTVDRATNGTGAVADLTYDEIAALDAAHWFTADCVCTEQPEAAYLYRGIRTGVVPAPEGYTADDFAIPTFEQLVQRFPDLTLNIEIKGNGAPAQAAADELARLLVALDRADAAVISSFDDEVVAYFHTLLPDVEVSPGLQLMTAWVLERTPLPEGMRILQLPPEFSGTKVISPELIADSTAAGYPIWVWPNNRDLENLASYTAFLEMGIVGLNINFPAQGVQAVQQFLP